MTVVKGGASLAKKKAKVKAGVDLKTLVEGVDLQSIFLVTVFAMRSPVDLSDNLSVSFDQKINGKFIVENSLVYEVNHRLEISNNDKQAYVAELGHIVTYTSKIPDPESKLIQQFGDESVRITIAPFVRELILRLTADAGLPPLLVGLAKRVSDDN